MKRSGVTQCYVPASAPKMIEAPNYPKPPLTNNFNGAF